jgi:6,7-dimethyl-8-ribityllumazine synthase
MATINKKFYQKVACQKRRIFFGVVVAEWNEEITEGLYNGAEAAF